MRGSKRLSRTFVSLFLLLVILFAMRILAEPAAALALPRLHDPVAVLTATPVQFFAPRYRDGPRVYRPRVQQRRYRKKPRPRVATPKCEPPWSYSQGLRKCICVLEGYGLSGGECVKLAELCTGSGEWSDADQACRCSDGHVLRDGQCVEARVARETLQSLPGADCFWPRIADEDSKACRCAPGYDMDDVSGLCESESGEDINTRIEEARADGLLTKDVALIQQCMKEAGYLRGDIAARMTKRAWTAFWFFKQDHKVGPTHKGVHEPEAQKVLFDLCPLAARSVKGTELAALRALRNVEKTDKPGPEENAQGGDEELPALKTGYARAEATCLPESLMQLVTRTYGERPELETCKQTCVPVPKGVSDREVALLERRGVEWCRDCLEIRTQLPLSDILRIERAGNVQICTRPPTRLPRWRRADGAPGVAYTRVRRLYRTLPSAASHADDIAVIIGNRNYQGGLPANESAHNNAGAVYALLSEHLGYSQENIIDLRDATLEDMTAVFGGPETRGELEKRLGKTKAASVLIYYAGHGTTNMERSESYLLPVDAIEHREERSAYPMSRLYETIGKLDARFVTLFLEAGFGRDQSDFVFAPNLPELSVRSLPARDIEGLTVMTASERDQRTMDDPEFGIGLFTRYLIEGLAGRADLAPIGNNDLKVDTVELYAYTAHMVDLSARKSYGMLQKPVLSGKANVSVSTMQAQIQ